MCIVVASLTFQYSALITLLCLPDRKTVVASLNVLAGVYMASAPLPVPSFLLPLHATRLDLKSPLHVWNSLLAETRRVAKEHSVQAEVYSTEMTARFEIMAKDVHVLSRRVCCVSVHFVSEYVYVAY